MHLHVPLYIQHPDLPAATVDDVVTTRGLFDVVRAAASQSGVRDTFLSPEHRARHAVAIAEHVHYPLPDAAPQYRHDLAACIVGDRKLVLHPPRIVSYDLSRDPQEEHPETTTLQDFAAQCRGMAPAETLQAMAHRLRRQDALSA